MVQRLTSLGLEAEFIPAVNGAQIDRSVLPPGTEPGLSPGELGCYLSHVHCWQTVVDQSLTHAIILEDDVLLSPDFAEVIKALTTVYIPYDAIRLSALMPVRGISVASLSGGYQLVLPNKNPSGCQGYLLSLAGARRLLACMAVPKQPIDSALDRYWKFDLLIPVLFPCIVQEDASLASSIVGRFGSRTRKTFLNHLRRISESKYRKIKVYFLARRVVSRRVVS